MTKEQILAMEAGVKLDDLVADSFGLPKANYNLPDETNYYSKSISDAWQVVEKMRDSDKYNFNRTQKGYKDKGQYDSTFADFCSELMKVLSIRVKESAYSATLTLIRELSPEAICKAALLTKLEAENE